MSELTDMNLGGVYESNKSVPFISIPTSISPGRVYKIKNNYPSDLIIDAIGVNVVVKPGKTKIILHINGKTLRLNWIQYKWLLIKFYFNRKNKGILKIFKWN